MSVFRALSAWWNLSPARRALLRDPAKIDRYNADADRYNADIDRYNADAGPHGGEKRK
jgi:hypothetical protein